MSEVLEARAEVIRLARLLGAPPETMTFMEKVGSEGLRKFRRQLVDVFYGSEQGSVERFAKIGNLLPSPVIAALTKEAVGPVLAARISGLVDPAQAIAIVARLPIDFVADIAVEIDPRRIGPVIGGLPSETVGALAITLVKRKEYVTLGELGGFADDDAQAVVFDAASDADLLQIAFVTENKENVSKSIALLSDKRLGSIMRTAGKEGLWAEALDLLRSMNDDDYFRVIDIAARQDEATLDAFITTAQNDALWDLVIPSIAQMADPAKTVAALLRADAATIKGFVDAVVKQRAWDDMRELLQKLSEHQLAELRKQIAEHGGAAKFKPVAELLAA